MRILKYVNDNTAVVLVNKKMKCIEFFPKE